MSKLFADVIGKQCKIFILGISDFKATIIDIDNDWIKVKYGKKEKIKFIRKCFVSSIVVIET